MNDSIARVLAGEDRWCIIEGDCLGVMGGIERVDHVITDPPYGIDCRSVGASKASARNPRPRVGKRSNVIAGDLNPNGEWLHLAHERMGPTGTLLSFSRWDVDREWHTLIEAAGFSVRNRIVWVKAHFGTGDCLAAYGCQHETLWRAQKGRVPLRVTRTGDVWGTGATRCVRARGEHPFEKPVELMCKAVAGDSEPGEIVLDPFCGGGSTGVAALRLGRRFIGIEIDATYAALARERLTAEERGTTTAASRARQEVLFQ